jgi:hypothetical protein
MNNHRIFTKILYFLSLSILFLFFTSSCRPEGITITPMSSKQTNQFPTKSNPTIILQATGMFTTPTVSFNPISSSIPPVTQVPTISPTEVPNFVTNLILNDVNCLLPCWLGIHPGKTTWDQAWHFLKSFSTQFGDSMEDNIVTENGIITIIKYAILYKISQEESGGAIFSIKNDIVKNIEIDPTGMEQFYPMPRLIKKLGTPDGVYISTFSDYGSHGDLEFGILMVYDEIRAYYLFEGEKVGETIRSCVNSQLVGPRLELGELLAGNEDLVPKGWLPIETATGVSIETFVLRSQDTKNKECLETPARLWP